MKKFIMAIPVGVISLLATAIIAYLSLASNPLDMGGIQLFAGADKVVHVLMYFFLAAVYLMDYTKFRLPHHGNTNIELVLTATAVCVGLGMEILQLMMPEQQRSFDILDWGADVLGAVIAFFVMKFKLLHYERKWLYHTSVKRFHHRHHHHYHENDSNL